MIKTIPAEILGPHGGFFITAFVSFFVIIDPLANAFSFLSLSAGSTHQDKRDLARRSCLYAFLVLTGFLFLGELLLLAFGITLAAFQIAGGLILFRIAFDMLEARGPFSRLDTSSSPVAADYRNVALVPLAVPLVSGPGAISAVLVLASRAPSRLDFFLILAALSLVLLMTYACFRFAGPLAEFLKESGLRLITRLMGLILAALAVQFVLEGVQQAVTPWFQ
jgi:multiple antibiotic resistance protein